MRSTHPASCPPIETPPTWMALLFRGTQGGRVLAYDVKTGKRLWETRIADPKRGESVPAAPIAWDGRIFVGDAGGDWAARSCFS
jgi:outer membrane protein assembly factor BamB